jgi:hypothetical protein
LVTRYDVPHGGPVGKKMYHADMRALVLSILMVMGLSAQPAVQIRTGPEVGVPIPKFAAPDQNGRIRTLETIAGPKGALLVFYRSADW